jgi:hypothetical protein
MPKVIRNLLYSLPEDVIRRVYEFDSTYLITQHPELIQEWRDKTHEPEKRKIREYVDQTISLGYRFRTLYGIFSKYRSQIQPGENWLGKDFDIYLMNIKNHYDCG